MRILFIALLWGLVLPLAAQPTTDPNQNYNADGRSINQLVNAYFSVVSGPAGERNWDRLRALCLEEAQMNAIQYGNEGDPLPLIGSVEDYIGNTDQFFRTNGYVQKEILRRTRNYGNSATIFSSYEGTYNFQGQTEAVTERGVITFQLVYDRGRWWIANILWNVESPYDPIPEKYLKYTK